MTSRLILVVVMGVSGCGKSTIAKALSVSLDYQFVEADDFHPEPNRLWMSAGKPLSEAMREPWIRALTRQLLVFADAGVSCVMSFSGLRREHRITIRELPFEVRFIHLIGEAELISERMAKREDHFMPESLLASQFLTLDDTAGEEHLCRIDIAQDIDAVVDQALRELH